VTIAQQWAKWIAETDAKDAEKAFGIVNCLHSAMGEPHDVMPDLQAGYCLQIFHDRSILDCSGSVVTPERAVEIVWPLYEWQFWLFLLCLFTP
jgi:hypothetical protein